MVIKSSADAGVFIESLRRLRGLSRKELSERSGIPLRTVYAFEGGELRNFSIDRLCSLLEAMDAHVDLCVDEPRRVDGTDKTNELVMAAARGGTGDADPWGIWS